MNIAVIGGGIAGSAAALFLKRQNHEITVFERETEPKPLGAGIMLQWTGKAVLENLGYHNFLETYAHPIPRFKGQTTDGDVKYFLDFEEYNPEKIGWGLQRGALFTMLFESLEKESIRVVKGCDISKVIFQNKKTLLYDQNNNEYNGFDLIIVANGARSKIRDQFGICQRSRQQSYSAIWAKIPLTNQKLSEGILQIYHKRDLLGFMPIGKDPHEENPIEMLNFFWGIAGKTTELLEPSNFKSWKEKLLKIAPEFKDQLEEIKSPDQLTFAPYADSKIAPLYHKNVVFIGDVAHAMSPQLSSGTNMALLDAFLLSESLVKYKNLKIALKSFSKKRMKQHDCYQAISRGITPFFQSPLPLNLFRDKILPAFYKVGFVKKLILETLTGTKKSWFQRFTIKEFQK